MAVEQVRKRAGGSEMETDPPIPAFSPGYLRPIGLRNQGFHVEDLWSQSKIVLDDLFKGVPVSKSEIMRISSKVHEFDIAPPDPKERRMGLCASARDEWNLLFYQRIGQLIIKHVEEVAQKKKGIKLQAFECLDFYYQECKQYNTACRGANFIFQHLNRWVIAQRNSSNGGNQNVFPILDLSQILWTKKVFKEHGITVGKALLMEIKNDRNEVADVGAHTAHKRRDMLKEVVRSFVQMGVDESKYEVKDSIAPNVEMTEDQIQAQRERKMKKEMEVIRLYRLIFEEPFIKETTEYYQEKVKELIERVKAKELQPIGFLEKIDSKFQAEELRATEYLHPSTVPKLNEICRRLMIFENMELIMQSCETVLQGDNSNCIAVFNRLMLRAGPQALNEFCTSLEMTILKRVRAAIKKLVEDGGVNNSQTAIKFACVVIEQYLKHDKLVTEVLNVEYNLTNTQNRSVYVGVLQRAFTTILKDNEMTMKQGGNATAKMLAKYSDALLKSDAKKKNKKKKQMSEEVREQKVRNLFTLVRFLDNKDFFQSRYQAHLIDRLVYDASCNNELERRIVEEKWGDLDNTKRQITIFEALETSKDLKAEYDFAFSDPKYYALTVTVMSSAMWPLSAKVIGWTVPEEIDVETERFQRFYENLHRGRHLSWIWNKSRGEVTYHTPRQERKILQINFEQASVLFQFQYQDNSTVMDIAAVTNIDLDDLKQILATLVVKTNILTMNEDSIDNVSPDTIITINKDWTTKDKVITEWQTLLSEKTRQEVKGIASVEQFRKFTIQAAIVRIMKASKAAVSSNDIVAAVIECVNGQFLPSVPDINKEMKELVGREYLRMEGSNYVYIA